MKTTSYLLKQEQMIIDCAKDELGKLIECLRYYLSEFVSRIKISVKSEQVEELGICDVLNFNYTSTYKFYNITEEQCHQIHGGIEKGDIVLGIEDTAFNDDLRYIFFNKYFQRIQKRTGAKYKSWFPSGKPPRIGCHKKEIHIIGHSLGESDGTILKELFESENSSQITIYYHDQSAYESQVINLVRIFGKDYVIEQTGEENIIFKQLDPPIACTEDK